MKNSKQTQIENLTEMIMAFENVTIEEATIRATNEFNKKEVKFSITDVTPEGYGN